MAVLAGAGVWGVRGHSGQPATPTGQPCGPWAHVYHPQRLKVIDPCKTITGTIAAIKREADGDFHIRLTTDDPALVNQANIDHQHGDLVIEPICENPVTQADAILACEGYLSVLRIPPVGTHVTVTGPFVEDKQHFNWREIHPIESVTSSDAKCASASCAGR